MKLIKNLKALTSVKLQIDLNKRFTVYIFSHSCKISMNLELNFIRQAWWKFLFYLEGAGCPLYRK